MTEVFEITTIAGKLQEYEVLQVSRDTSPNGREGIDFKTLNKEDLSGSGLQRMGHHSYMAYHRTGLHRSIKLYPPILDLEHNGAHFTDAPGRAPERLRLIYDLSPTSISKPILRVCPIGKERIYLATHNLRDAEIPLRRVAVSPEFEGAFDFDFGSLLVMVTMREFESENEHYYSRNLRESRILD